MLTSANLGMSIALPSDRNACTPAMANGHAEPAAGDRDEQSLREELEEDEPWRRSECALDGEGVPATFGAHEKQVSDVCARDEQHEGGGPEDHPQHPPDIPDDNRGERTHRHAHVRLLDRGPRQAARELVRQKRKEPLQIGSGRIHGDAVAQPRDRLVVERGRVGFRRIQAHRATTARCPRPETERRPA